MSISLYVQIILALPKIMTLLKGLKKMVIELNDKEREKKHQQDLAKLQEAKTEQEVKDAAKDYLSRI